MVTSTPLQPRPSALSVALNLLGIAAVGFSLLHDDGSVLEPRALEEWMLALGLVGLAAWLVVTLLDLMPGAPRTIDAVRFALVIIIIIIVSGGLLTAPTAGLFLALVAVGVLRSAGQIAWPRSRGVLVILLAVVLVAAGAVVAGSSPLALLAQEAGVTVIAAIAVARRQFRTAQLRSIELAHERVAMREEQARMSVLADRAAVARDIHDVLAHSLGGLVVQLDAVEALLEAGRTADAAERVGQARGLAAAGLSEARRAVDALRMPPAAGAGTGGGTGPLSADVPVAAVFAQTDELVGAHRSLGGSIAMTTPAADGDAVVGAEASTALRRALQEALTNARRHAPDQAVTVRYEIIAGRLILTVSNELATRDRSVGAAGSTGSAGSARATGSAGGGFGLLGMTERFRALDDCELTAGVVAEGAGGAGHFKEDEIPSPARTGTASTALTSTARFEVRASVPLGYPPQSNATGAGL